MVGLAPPIQYVKVPMIVSEKELVFRASRSAGPGGQNVNKVNTRIALFFDVTRSNSLNQQQKQKIISRLSSRIDKDGFLRVVSQKYRTQNANRQAAIEHLEQLLADALKEKPKREKTQIPYSAINRRLKQKRNISLKKQRRSEKDFEDF
jgi:ribosome-associated protein